MSEANAETKMKMERAPGYIAARPTGVMSQIHKGEDGKNHIVRIYYQDEEIPRQMTIDPDGRSEIQHEKVRTVLFAIRQDIDDYVSEAKSVLQNLNNLDAKIISKHGLSVGDVKR